VLRERIAIRIDSNFTALLSAIPETDII
jgi:hypothetical protein